MRIISEFHDYYDVVQAMGQDQTLLFCFVLVSFVLYLWERWG